MKFTHVEVIWPPVEGLLIQYLSDFYNQTTVHIALNQPVNFYSYMWLSQALIAARAMIV